MPSDSEAESVLRSMRAHMNKEEDNHFKLPLPLVVGVIMYMITSIPAAIWFVSSSSAIVNVRLQNIEAELSASRDTRERLTRMEVQLTTTLQRLQAVPYTQPRQ